MAPHIPAPAKRRALARGLGLLLLVGLSAACAKREPALQGVRLDLRASLAAPVTAETAAKTTAKPTAETTAKPAATAPPLRLPAAVKNANWPQRNGSAAHHIPNPAFSATPRPIWSASIGDGNSRKYRITADPVVEDGRIFTLDSRATVMAHSSAGALLWSQDVTPASDRDGDAAGGGLAVAGGTLFVTSGFGELVALDAKTGRKRWVQRLDASVTGAPAVKDGLVYVVSRDSRAWAIDVKDGRIRWELSGVPPQAVMVGGAAPAVTRKFVIFPFGSGDLIAAFRKGGLRIWEAPIAGHRRGRVYASIDDVTGDPVVVGNVVYAGNAGGRVVALDLNSGERLWTADQGTYGPVWPVVRNGAGAVFLVSDQDALVRLNAATGEQIWSVQLPYYTKKKIKRRKAIYANYGPVLAGGRLIVPSSDGVIRAFDPVSGAELAGLDIPGGAATNPVFANATMYVVSAKGQLHAYR